MYRSLLVGLVCFFCLLSAVFVSRRCKFRVLKHNFQIKIQKNAEKIQKNIKKGERRQRIGKIVYFLSLFWATIRLKSETFCFWYVTREVVGETLRLLTGKQRRVFENSKRLQLVCCWVFRGCLGGGWWGGMGVFVGFCRRRGRRRGGCGGGFVFDGGVV